MPDYKSMYYRLFNRVSDAITALQHAQQESEEMMILKDDKPVILTAEPTADNELK